MRAEAVTFNSFVERICLKMLTVDSKPNPLIDGDVERVESTVEVEKQVQTKEASLSEEDKKAITTRIEAAKRQRYAEVQARLAELNIKQNQLSSLILGTESFMQQAKSDISKIKTDLQAARQTLSTAPEQQKQEAEATINAKIGELNTKIATLESKKTEIQTIVNDAIKLCPLGGCETLLTATDTFSRKVSENAPQIIQEVQNQRAQVAQSMQQRITDQDTEIKTHASQVEAKRIQFEQAFEAVQSNPTSETAKLDLLAKTNAMKAAGAELATKLQTRNQNVSNLINRNANTFGAQPKLLDETMRKSVETVKKVQESVAIKSTVDFTQIDTMLSSNVMLDGSFSPPTTDFKNELLSFSATGGSTTDLRLTIKPPTLPPTSTSGSTTTTGGNTTTTTEGNTTTTGGNTTTTGGNTTTTTGGDTTTTGGNTTTTGGNTTTTGGNTTTTQPPKLRILQNAEGVTVVPDSDTTALSYPGPQDGAPNPAVTLNISQQTTTTQADPTSRFARGASIFAVMVFCLIATIY